MSFYAVFYSVQNAIHYHIKDQSYCKLILCRLVSLSSDLLHSTLHNVRPVSNVLLLPLYTGSTVLRYLFSCPRLAFYCWALSAIMILKTNAFSVVSSSFAIYLKVYWNGTTVFLFIVLRVHLTILAVTWLFFQVFSKISLINRRYNDKRITRTSNTV